MRPTEKNTKPRDSLQMAQWVTRKPLLSKPIHRWFTFPHSFTSELVHSLIDDWSLSRQDSVIDPFVGAGTTVLAAKEREVPAAGYDISPLAAFVSSVKTRTYDDVCSLGSAAKELDDRISEPPKKRSTSEYPAIVRRALPGRILPTMANCRDEINRLPYSTVEKDFMTLALLSTLPRYSRARPSGGWLKWSANSSRSTSFRGALRERLDQMITDVEAVQLPTAQDWHVEVADARSLPESSGAYSGVITSPPYPNRHDYTRVFGIELLFGFLNTEQLRSLRKQTLESHPEARPERKESPEYQAPELLSSAIDRLRDLDVDARVVRMLEGYFRDMHLFLLEAQRICMTGGRIALVVGNAQYAGVPILVDQIVASIGESIGLRCEGLCVARLRGNSAQQMAKYGRQPSRETIVTFRRCEDYQSVSQT